MDKFIKYTFLFILPFIIGAGIMEYLLRKIPNDYFIKNEYLTNNSAEIKILILGSSHSLNDLDPSLFHKKAYIGANVSQTLDIDYKVLQKFEDQLDSLEYIIIPISYHSLFSKLDTGIEDWRSKYYNIYYNIKIEQSPLKTPMILTGTMKYNLQRLNTYYLKGQTADVNIDELGMIKMKPCRDLEKLKKESTKAANRHTSPNINYFLNENLKYLDEIIELANKMNAKVIFFTPPFHKEYRALLNQKQLDITIQAIEKINNNKNVFYYNFIDTYTEYQLQDFANGDHLSYLGAKKFTMKLDSIIKDIENQSIAIQQAIEN